MPQPPEERPPHQQWSPPPQPPPYAMPPMPMPRTTRSQITGSGHSVHLVLTVLTCGLWGIVWFLHWLFTRSKTTTRY